MLNKTTLVSCTSRKLYLVYNTLKSLYHLLYISDLIRIIKVYIHNYSTIIYHTSLYWGGVVASHTINITAFSNAVILGYLLFFFFSKLKFMGSIKNVNRREEEEYGKRRKQMLHLFHCSFIFTYHPSRAFTLILFIGFSAIVFHQSKEEFMEGKKSWLWCD